MAPACCTERKPRKICYICPSNSSSECKITKAVVRKFFINVGSVATFNESVELVVQNMVQRHKKTPKYKKGNFFFELTIKVTVMMPALNRFCNSVVTKGRSKAVPCFIYATL
jgi:hypothetical protein